MKTKYKLMNIKEIRHMSNITKVIPIPFIISMVSFLVTAMSRISLLILRKIHR